MILLYFLLFTVAATESDAYVYGQALLHNHGPLHLESSSTSPFALPSGTIDTHAPGFEYEAQFPGLDKNIVGRASVPAAQITGIVADTPKNDNIEPGTSFWYSFQAVPTPPLQARHVVSPPSPLGEQGNELGNGRNDSPLGPYSETIELDARDDNSLESRQAGPQGKVVYVSINTCIQPTYDSDAETRRPPQLSLHAQVQDPRQNDDDDPPGSQTVELVEGLANIEISTSSDLFVRVSSPNSKLTKDSADWNYDVVASTDQPYHSFVNDNDLQLYLIDSDPTAALLVTSGLEKWTRSKYRPRYIDPDLEKGPPLDIFVNNINYTDVAGLGRSYCKLWKSSQVRGTHEESTNPGYETGITHNQPGRLAEQQFYIPDLNKTSTFYSTITMINGTEGYGLPQAGGGGTVYPVMNFTTKRDSNCAVIYNLTFCQEVQYAVPANPSKYNFSALRDLYDSQAAALFQNFSYSLQQVPCNTTPSAQYSLAAGCDNCTEAYKTWLCTVSIPKCADFVIGPNTTSSVGTISNNSAPDNSSSYLSDLTTTPQDFSYLMPRNVAQAPLANSSIPPIQNSTQLSWLATNSSRMNSTIAGQIQPGPYMEVLPCEDLCYDIVRMCPATLGFSCPKPGSMLMRASYGVRGTGEGGEQTCSAPGALYYKSGARRRFDSMRGELWLGWFVVVVAAWTAL